MKPQKDVYEFAEVTQSQLSAINRLVELARNCSPNGDIETDYDWTIVGYLFDFWKGNRPIEYRHFSKHMKELREVYKINKHGVAEEKGGAAIQHVNTMPESFYGILSKFFPNFKMDKKFFRRLQKELPIFQMQTESKI